MVIGVIKLVCLIREILFICDGISLLFVEIKRNFFGSMLFVCFDWSCVFVELFVKIICEGVRVMCLVGVLVLIKMCKVCGMLGL